MNKERLVYAFNESKASEESAFLLGNKGAQLAEMTAIGLMVPPGFTITTEACKKYYELEKKWPKGLEEQVKEKLKELEKKMNKKLGDKENPLFVSVRSGSYVSMPGMMDTVLNLGMNDESVKAFSEKTKNERVAWDSYRRFIQMFSDVVMELSHSDFEELLEKKKHARKVKFDTDLSAQDLKELVEDYKKLVKAKGKSFPQNPEEQLRMTINAVFESWNSSRAISYRRINSLKDDAGTAVNIQAMVFGNKGNSSATGVGFTRNPATGEKEHYGEYLLNAQGEDVVAGIRTPKHIDEMKKDLPESYEKLIQVYEKLEKHFKDLQDFEFTIEENRLYLLQTRNGKRTAKAAVKIAVDMVKEKILTEKEALLKINANQLNQLLHKQLDEKAKKEFKAIAKGLAASPGAAVGKVVFSAEKAKELFEKNPGEKIILVRAETSPDDIEGMHVAQGILTSRGGLTSHAAVVARGMGKCCIVGCEEISIKGNPGEFTTSKQEVIKVGEWITLDGATGEIFKGQIPVTDPTLSKEFEEIMHWADKYRKLKVRANADTPIDARKAREFGAEGIGLCRTEHMFFQEDRIKTIREMILAKDLEGRKKALEKIKPLQKNDFKELFREMNGFPVTIRFLDPPLHEFLPFIEKDVEEMSKEMNVEKEIIKAKVESLKETNPMLGHRGVRLGLSYPEVYEMQARAALEAALEVSKEGIKVLPEIEIPLVGTVKELTEMKKIILKVAEELKLKEKGVKFKIGTMIELPRACITADEIAKEAEFFSFGTNDLTQTTYGFSRDDIGKFVQHYEEKKIFEKDPFAVLDQEGVGKLMKLCVELGRKTNPELEIGICGEHGGEASSVEFCHKIGLNYVSCSPFRVPIAKLAAAQMAIKEKQVKN